MISEIYACGQNNTSAFLIVESGAIVHHGVHQWQGTITFEGISEPVSKHGCETLAIICAIMLCRQNNRQAVNVYTQTIEKNTSAFAESLRRHAEGIDIYRDRWPTVFYDKATRSYYPNAFAEQVVALTKLTN